jgi:hypothetical protein
MSDPVGIQCPSCGGTNVTVRPHGIAHCNDCGGELLVQTEESESSENAGTLDYRTEEELSELHIRNISNLRRGAYRERSYWIIGAALCLVAAVKLLQIAWAAWRRDLKLGLAGDVAGAVAAAMIFFIAIRRITELTHEIRRSRLAEPTQPPDFSHLGDGSQRIRDLEAMTNPTQGDQPNDSAHT